MAFLPGLTVAIFLTLCSIGDAPALAAADQAGSTAPLISANTLVVGSEQDYPPFALGQTDETADGFTVDLWKVIARDAGLNYTLRVKPFHQLLQDFKDGKIDVLINLAQSDERHKFADFTVPHVTVHGAIFFRKDADGIAGEDDLMDKSIIAVKADIAHEYAISKGWQSQLTLVATAAEGLQLLASGQHDAMFVSKLVGMQTLERLKLSGIAALPVTAGARQKFSFAVQKGNADLLALLNEGLALSKSSGAYDALYQKWFSVYEDKKPALRDTLKYLLPLLAGLVGFVAVSYYRQRAALRQLAESHHMLQTIIETIPMRVFWKDKDSRFLGCNTLFANDAGKSSPAEVIGKSDADFSWREQAPVYRADDLMVVSSGKAKLAYDEPMTTPDGRRLWLRTSKTPILNLNQEVIGVLGLFDDITGIKETELALIESERRLSEILENVSAHIYLKDGEGRYLFANKPVRDLWGLPLEQIIGFGDEAFFDGETAANIRKNDQRVLVDGETLRVEEINTTQTGATSTFWSVKLPLRRENGDIYALCGISTDISELKRTQEQMLLASMVYENSSESMMVTDADGDIITINPAFTKTTGYALADVLGKNARILKSGRHDRAFFQGLWNAINATGVWQGEVWDRRKNGEVYPKWLSINTTFNADGTPYRRVALFSDITEKKKSEKVIWQQANFDNLTGLPNRRMFYDRLQQEIKKANRSERHLALLFIDLDRFKEINDSLGHDKGDLLLAEAAQRLLGCVRESDTVARLGGDEFTIILGEVDEIRGVERIVQCILKRMAAPFTLAEEMAYVSASIGITVYPEDATSGDALLKNADQAMYAAKHQGRNRCSYFTQAMDESAKTRMRLSNDLRTALAEGQFWVAYQPIVELGSGAIRKAEALLRWQHPSRGLVSPAEFIPIAEETGLIIEIGNWVFQQAADQVVQWRRAHDLDFQISVNKSPAQFLDDGSSVNGWLELMQDMALPWQSIVVEITEGLLLKADPIVDHKVSRFRQAGMQFAIDDFGTGYSSLSYLKKFDIDYLKIDQSFIANLAPGSADLALCEAIIVMAHKLGIKVIAEGVETLAQRELLLAAGCDYGQGFFFSRPIAAEAFEKLLGRT